MLISGDTGGTKTLLALYTPEAGARAPLRQTEFHSADFPDLAPMVRLFLEQAGGARPTHGCFDVAGPVIDGRATLTNLPWRLEETRLAADLGLQRVILLNDLQAVAYAVPRLGPEERRTLNAGTPREHGAIGVVAPGTGLGEAFAVWHDGAYVACSSEGGHADFAPLGELQGELWRYLLAKFGHASYERVCSGQGIANIYDFLRDSGHGAEDPAFAERLRAARDRTPLISQAALSDPAGNPLAAQALDIFVAILGAEAGNMALRVMATGGVFLAGGIPGRVLPLLERDDFLRAFTQKGRFVAFLSSVPVHVVMANAALLGAALYGLDKMSAG
jgi:glucokinase